MYRQGDVLFVVEERLPADAAPSGDPVVAHGEATGHAHRLDARGVQFVTREGAQFVEVPAGGASVTHEEHAAVHLPGPAVYRVVHQREYEPASVETVTRPGWRPVVD